MFSPLLKLRHVTYHGHEHIPSSSALEAVLKIILVVELLMQSLLHHQFQRFHAFGLIAVLSNLVPELVSQFFNIVLIEMVESLANAVIAFFIARKAEDMLGLLALENVGDDYIKQLLRQPCDVYLRDD